MKPDRIRRVNELLKRELSELCERHIAPFSDSLITVTRIETSTDLRHATVYVSVMGEQAERERVLKMLYKYHALFQKELARHIKMKFTPVLKFGLDTSLEEADRVLSILNDLQKEAADSEQETPEGR